MKQQGFSLLEAIVALVLITTTGLALYDWINTNLNNLYRVQHLHDRHAAIRNAIAFVETINPLKNARGESTVGVYTFRWESEVIKPPKDGTSGLKGLGLYQVGLYNVKIDILREDDAITTVTLQQIGYEQVRQPAWKNDSFSTPSFPSR